MQYLIFSRRVSRPSFAWIMSALRKEGQGRPGGRMHPGLPRKTVAQRARKPQGTGGDNRPSLRDGLRLIARSPRWTLPIATVIAAKLSASLGLERQTFGAPGPHAFAVRLRAARQQAHPRPPHSAPRSWRSRRAPLHRRGTAGL